MTGVLIKILLCVGDLIEVKISCDNGREVMPRITAPAEAREVGTDSPSASPWPATSDLYLDVVQVCENMFPMCETS